MFKRLSYFCTRYPWLIFLITLGITAFMLNEIKTKLYFEPDLSKFLPSDMPTVKSDDYSRKNLNYRDVMLVGVEKTNGTVLDIAEMRAMEQIVLDFKQLRAEKTFFSILTGKEETLTLPVGINGEDISSLPTLEDAIFDLETGSVISGSVIKKLKEDLGITSPKGMEERLPVSDADLQRIMPQLKQIILQDRTFRGSVLSEDLQSTTMQIPMIRKWQYKRRYVLQEFSTAIDAASLKARFQGQESTFPFTIYGKTLGKISVDDDYIQKHTASVQKSLQAWLIDNLEGTFEAEPKLEELLRGDLSKAKFQAIMNYMERKDFYMHPKMASWENFMNYIYGFMLTEIDPFSRDNLNFQLFNVKDIYDLNLIYSQGLEILKKHSTPEMNFYVGGSPVIFAIFSSMMSEDMGRMLPMSILVVLILLAISFRSVRGVLIPLITVVLSVLWSLGLMATLGVPLSITTAILPIVLLAVGTAYGIHLLSRYYEDAPSSKNSKEAVKKTLSHVGVAIVMAALTTVAGFSSLGTSKLGLIRHFGLFSAFGVGVALLLSITLSPALLAIWRLPKKKKSASHQDIEQGNSLINRLIKSWTLVVIKSPKAVVGVLLFLMIGAGGMMSRNYFEGSIMTNFKVDNPVYKSDEFLNKNLTGTGMISLIFSFRDEIDLSRPEVQKDLQERIRNFTQAWQQLQLQSPGLQESFAPQIIAQLQDSASRLPQSKQEVFEKINLLRDILNEEYFIEIADQEEELSDDSDLDALDEDLDDLDTLGEDSDELDGLGEDSAEDSEIAEQEGLLADLTAEQTAGLKEINQRFSGSESHWEKNAEAIVTLREQKNSATGIQMQRSFNLLQDFLVTDIKQPNVLHRLEDLYAYLKAMENPQIVIQGQAMNPTGFIFSPVDMIRKFYKVFYHDGNNAYDRLPNSEKDGFEDKTLTDRSIIGVVLNQAQSADRDRFEQVITPNLKDFQMQIMVRDQSNQVVTEYSALVLAKVKEIFPEDDPYIQRVRIGGAAPKSLEVTNMISTSQAQSIGLSFLFVLIVTFFIFGSIWGGLLSLVPLFFTVVMNFGMIYLLGGEISVGTMLVASISIGTGVDYTIHFLERFKLQLGQGDSFTEAYLNTTMSSGKAILLNALSVAMGFLVLLFSEFVPNMMMGLLMAGTMAFSSLGAMTLLPAIILITKPKFFNKKNAVQPAKAA